MDPSSLTVPPLNVTQTPVSGARQTGDVSTGPFFSGLPKQPDFAGPADLLGGGASVSAGGGVGLAIAGAVLFFALLRVKK